MAVTMTICPDLIPEEAKDHLAAETIALVRRMKSNPRIREAMDEITRARKAGKRESE